MISYFSVLFRVVGPPFLKATHGNRTRPCILIIEKRASFIETLHRGSVNILKVTTSPLRGFYIPFELPVKRVTRSYRRPRVEAKHVSSTRFSFRMFERKGIINGIRATTIIANVTMETSCDTPCRCIRIFCRKFGTSARGAAISPSSKVVDQLVSTS